MNKSICFCEKFVVRTTYNGGLSPNMTENTQQWHDTNLAPFNPSSETAQRQSIALMGLTSDDVLFDLGCGDGRLLIRAVSEVPGLCCVGVEIDPIFVERANKAVTNLSEEVQQRIQIRCQDVTKILGDTQT